MKEQHEAIDGFRKGDWVRFYTGGKLVIGQIEYFWVEAGGYEYAGTDNGSVRLDSVLEHRVMRQLAAHKADPAARLAGLESCDFAVEMT